MLLSCPTNTLPIKGTLLFVVPFATQACHFSTSLLHQCKESVQKGPKASLSTPAISYLPLFLPHSKCLQRGEKDVLTTIQQEEKNLEMCRKPQNSDGTKEAHLGQIDYLVFKPCKSILFINKSSAELFLQKIIT